MSGRPNVVIVGRMNVGKSTLFNRLSEQVKSITLDYEGVTRDVVTDMVQWAGKQFQLSDTGGISFVKQEDKLAEQVRQKALHALEDADVVLFVVDGTTGIVSEDEDIARVLRTYNKPIILVVNKIDSKRAQDNMLEFYALPHDQVVGISAEHGIGTSDLLEAVISRLPERDEEEEQPRFKVAFLGRPNVGKSSLLNALVKTDRSIVSDIPGTTREAISEKILFYQQHIQITDTPGVRRRRAVEGNLEPLMVQSTFEAVRDADIVVLLIDAHEAGVVDQELKLAHYAFSEQYKALIILINKVDLDTDDTQYFRGRDFERYEYFLRKVPQLNISCKTGKNVGKVVPLITEVWDRYSQRLSDELINRVCVSSLQRTPLMHNQQPIRLYRAFQLNTAPITIALEVNEPEWVGDSERAFFENVLRDTFDLRGVPVKFVIRRRF